MPSTDRFGTICRFYTASITPGAEPSRLIYLMGAQDKSMRAACCRRGSLWECRAAGAAGRRSAYVDMCLQAGLALRESNVRLISQELQAAKDRFDVGEVTLTDVSLAEARRAAAQSGLAAAQGALEVARERYKAAIGHYPGKLAGLPKLPFAAKSEDAARAIAVRNHPVIKQAGHEVKISDIRVKIAEAAFLPTVSSSLSVSEDWLSGSGNTGLDQVHDTIYQGANSALHPRRWRAEAWLRRAAAQVDASGA